MPAGDATPPKSSRPAVRRPACAARASEKLLAGRPGTCTRSRSGVLGRSVICASSGGSHSVAGDNEARGLPQGFRPRAIGASAASASATSVSARALRAAGSPAATRRWPCPASASLLQPLAGLRRIALRRPECRRRSGRRGRAPWHSRRSGAADRRPARIAPGLGRPFDQRAGLAGLQRGDLGQRQRRGGGFGRDVQRLPAAPCPARPRRRRERRDQRAPARPGSGCVSCPASSSKASVCSASPASTAVASSQFRGPWAGRGAGRRRPCRAGRHAPGE